MSPSLFTQSLIETASRNSRLNLKGKKVMQRLERVFHSSLKSSESRGTLISGEPNYGGKEGASLAISDNNSIRMLIFALAEPPVSTKVPRDILHTLHRY